MKIYQAINYLFSIPKTIYVNFRVLPIKQAIKLPLFVAWDVNLSNLKKNVIFFDQESIIYPLMVAIGFNGTEVIPCNKSLLNLESGKLVIKGKCSIAKGCTIDVSGGILTFGNNFSANRNFIVSCNKEINIGDDVLIGWNVLFFDATGHIIYHKGVKKESFKPIIIGNHVWICAEAHILKGSIVPNDSVVAYKSLVTSKFDTPNILIGGTPATQLQTEISWGNFIKKNGKNLMKIHCIY